MEKTRKISRDVWIGIGLMAFSGYFLFEATKIPGGAGEFPEGVLTIFLILSALMTIMGVGKTIDPTREKKSDKAEIHFFEIKSPLVVFLITFLYILLIGKIGFFIATTLFIPVIMLYYGVRKYWQILLTTAGLDVFVYVLFVRLLSVVLP